MSSFDLRSEKSGSASSCFLSLKFLEAFKADSALFLHSLKDFVIWIDRFISLSVLSMYIISPSDSISLFDDLTISFIITLILINSRFRIFVDSILSICLLFFFYL